MDNSQANGKRPEDVEPWMVLEDVMDEEGDDADDLDSNHSTDEMESLRDDPPWTMYDRLVKDEAAPETKAGEDDPLWVIYEKVRDEYFGDQVIKNLEPNQLIEKIVNIMLEKLFQDGDVEYSDEELETIQMLFKHPQLGLDGYIDLVILPCCTNVREDTDVGRVLDVFLGMMDKVERDSSIITPAVYKKSLAEAHKRMLKGGRNRLSHIRLSVICAQRMDYNFKDDLLSLIRSFCNRISTTTELTDAQKLRISEDVAIFREMGKKYHLDVEPALKPFLADLELSD